MPGTRKAWVRMIREYNPFIQIGVPTQFMKLTQQELKDVNILGISGSAPLSEMFRRNLTRKAEEAASWKGTVFLKCRRRHT